MILQFYIDQKPLQCEIDAYGDFLQALGPCATSEVRRGLPLISVFYVGWVM